MLDFDNSDADQTANLITAKHAAASYGNNVHSLQLLSFFSPRNDKATTRGPASYPMR